jgi:hypothetical protein
LIVPLSHLLNGKIADAKWNKFSLIATTIPMMNFIYDFFSACVIGSDLNAERDIVHVNITTLWFVCNIIRKIATGWVF